MYIVPCIYETPTLVRTCYPFADKLMAGEVLEWRGNGIIKLPAVPYLCIYNNVLPEI